MQQILLDIQRKKKLIPKWQTNQDMKSKKALGLKGSTPPNKQNFLPNAQKDSISSKEAKNCINHI